MSEDALKRVGELSGSRQIFDAVTGQHGLFWRSEQVQVEPSSYEAHSPAGLHIGCGIASLTTHCVDLGGFAVSGVGATAMLCPEGAGPFITQLSSRTSRASGLFIAAGDLEARAGDAILQDVVTELASGAPLRAAANIPQSLVARLCAPIDPWFQGAARDLAFEARALEMAAMTLSWLSSKSVTEPSPTKHERHAFAARELLEQRLCNPPTLNELARAVGINTRTLTDAFRVCFKTSVAAYVTARRLDLAVSLLDQGLSPTEAAQRVGYRPTHLSVAFRKRYGMLPSQLASTASRRATNEKH